MLTYKNDEPKPTALEVKTLIDAQVAHLDYLPYEKRLGAYAWAAQVTNSSTREVRYWCDPKHPKGVPYCDWCILRLAAGFHVEPINPLDGYSEKNG